MLGQLGFFFRKPERNEDALALFTPEGGRLLQVLEKRLAAVTYLAGAEYSIADIATYPWVSGAPHDVSPSVSRRNPCFASHSSLVKERRRTPCGSARYGKH